MNGNRMVLVGVAALLALAYLASTLTARGGYESAEYEVLESEGPYEIREYADLMMATTTMRFAGQGDNGSFMRLFRYISGDNDRQEKVAMTTPVFMEAEAEDRQGRMAFMIPKEVAANAIPDPSNNAVEIRERAGGRFASFRFSGRINSKTIGKAEEQLRRWIAEKGYVTEGEAEFAGYDPPWTPGPLRRNEVLIRLK